jgi:sugar phosphate isomerase/epimerase
MTKKSFSRKDIVISTYLWSKQPIFSQLEEVKKSGIEKLEIWGNTPEHFNYSARAQIRKLQNLLNKYQLKVISFHTPISFNFSLLEKNAEEKLLPIMFKGINILKEFQGKLLVLHLRMGEVPAEAPEKRFSFSRKALSSLLKYAQEREIKIGLENTIQPPKNVAEIRSVIKKLNHSGLGLCYDIGHDVLDKRKEAPFNFSFQNVFNIHLSDNDLKEDLHLPLGKGKIAWSKFFKKLKQENYQGYLTLELHPTLEIKESIEASCQALLSQISKFS